MAVARILVVDDDRALCATLTEILEENQFYAAACHDAAGFFRMLEQETPDLVLMDIFLGSDNGLQLLRQMKKEAIATPVIVMTAHSEVSLAVRAMKEGAVDFVAKPFDVNHLLMLLARNIEHTQLQTRVRMLEEELGAERSKSGIIGRSDVIHRVLDTAEKLAAGNNTTVLLEGESGTGKELIARYIHSKSRRADRPFVAINCGSIPEELAETEFFGYERGAYTGARERTKQGRFELAEGGTILLDEVRELSLDMQVKLLHVLEEKRFYRLGGSKEVQLDVRVIAASNRDLAREVEDGRFREDLYYRLNVASIKVPPLRSRREDIPDLAQAFLGELCSRFNRPVPELSPEAILSLQQLPWKGNVRELRNAVERVVLLHQVPVLLPEHFAFLRAPGATPASPRASFVLELPPSGAALDTVVRELVVRTLELVGGNQVQAARMLGVTRSKLRYRMEQLGIHPEQRSYRMTP
jgi:two-component system, NtrC family, response regulator AtoC